MKSWERLMLYGMFAVIVGGILVGAKTRTQKLVRAERIEIVDAEGVVRIELAVSETRDVSVILTGPMGKTILGAGNEGTGFVVLSREGVPRVTLGTQVMGNAGMGIYSGMAQPLIGFRVTAMGEASANILDSNGAFLLQIPKEQ